MSLDKAIKHHKEYRKQYYGSKAIDPSCRNHGGCDWCLENRIYKYKKKQLQLDQKEQEYYTEGEINMTNKEYLFHLDDYDLAEYLITFVRQDSEGNDIYADPSGIEWFIFEDAVEATIEWLNKEVNE